LASGGRRIMWMAHECAPKNFTAVDVTDPTNLKLLGTALAGSISNANDINCSIQRGDLVILADTGSTLTSGGPPSWLST